MLWSSRYHDQCNIFECLYPLPTTPRGWENIPWRPSFFVSLGIRVAAALLSSTKTFSNAFSSRATNGGRVWTNVHATSFFVVWRVRPYFSGYIRVQKQKSDKANSESDGESSERFPCENIMSARIYEATCDVYKDVDNIFQLITRKENWNLIYSTINLLRTGLASILVKYRRIIHLLFTDVPSIHINIQVLKN